MVLSTPVEQDVTTNLAVRVRTANWELVRAAVASLGDVWDLEDGTFELLCECCRVGCQGSVFVTVVDYVDVRSNGFDVVARGHEDPREPIVTQTEDYTVVARADRRQGRV